MQLENKVAIVTGAAHGIGLAVARRYAAEGAKVVLADVDAAAGEAAAAAIGETRCRFVATDVGAARDAENLVAETCRLFGGVDVLVNNAGIVHGAKRRLSPSTSRRPISTECSVSNSEGRLPGRPGRGATDGGAGQDAGRCCRAPSST